MNSLETELTKDSDRTRIDGVVVIVDVLVHQLTVMTMMMIGWRYG